MTETVEQQRRLCEAKLRFWDTVPARAAARAIEIMGDNCMLVNRLAVAKHIVHGVQIAGIEDAAAAEVVAKELIESICPGPEGTEELYFFARGELTGQWGGNNWGQIPAVVYDPMDETGKGTPVEFVDGEYRRVVSEPHDEASEEEKEAHAKREAEWSKVYKLQLARLDWLADKAEGRLLDVGCGVGSVLSFILNKGEGVLPSNHIGVDMDLLAKPAFERALGSKADFMCKNVYDVLPFMGGEFGTVVMAEILEHLLPRFIPRVLAEATRVGKQVILTTPNALGDAAVFGTICAGEHCQLITRDALEFYLNPTGAMRDGIYDEWKDCPTYEYEIEETPLFWLAKIRRA